MNRIAPSLDTVTYWGDDQWKKACVARDHYAWRIRLANRRQVVSKLPEKKKLGVKAKRSQRGVLSQAKLKRPTTLPGTDPPSVTPRKRIGAQPSSAASSMTQPADAKNRSVTLEARAMTLAKRLFSDPRIWLETPNSQFGGRKPIDLMQNGEAGKVYDLLRAADLGLFS